MSITRDNRSRLSIKNDYIFEYSNSQVNEHIKELLIEELFVPTMIKNLLLKAGILSIDDLLKISINELSTLDRIGLVMLNMIKNLIYEILYDENFERNFIMKDIFSSSLMLKKKAHSFFSTRSF